MNSSSQAAATLDLPGSQRVAPDDRKEELKRQRVVDFTNADVEMNQALPLARDVNRWLDWQCRMISGVRQGAVFLLPKVSGGALERAAIWPEDETRSSHLRAVAAKAIGSADGLTEKYHNDGRDGGEVCDFVAYPLLRNGKVVGAVALALAIRSEAQHQAVLQLLQWGTVWVEEAIVRGGEAGRVSAALLMEAAGQLHGDSPLPVAAHHLCNLLADTLECSRVALSEKRGLQSRVIAISHQLKFDHRARPIAQIEFAMEEAVDRKSAVRIPQDEGDEPGISQAHVQLASDNGGAAVCSIPLVAGDRAVGALTLIRSKGQCFDDDCLELIEALARQTGPLVALKQDAARAGWGSLLHMLGNPLRRLLGRGHLRLKLGVLALLLTLLTLGLVQTDHLIAARSNVEGKLQQVVVAPFAGYLREAKARAGDRVEAGQLLAALDERELLLEQEKLSGERAKHRKEYQQALAERDRAKVAMISARIEQVDAQLRLVGDQLERTRLQAPFAGLLVTGDWSRALGAPVERGQVLFEIVPDEDFRIILEVDEHDVSYLEPGQPGHLRLAGMPGDPIAFEVARIFPVAAASDGVNHFRVEATLSGVPSGLRPGMQGVAKVTVGRDSLFNVWTASLRSRLRLWAWSLGV